MGKKKSYDDPIHLTQEDADRLVVMEKHCLQSKCYPFPREGEKVMVPLVSEDRRHEFEMDVYSSRIDLKKYTFGNRTRRVITLIRVDIGSGGRHVNPDNEAITGPHIHKYREGFGDKWAEPLPDDLAIRIAFSTCFSVLWTFAGS